MTGRASSHIWNLKITCPCRRHHVTSSAIFDRDYSTPDDDSVTLHLIISCKVVNLLNKLSGDDCSNSGDRQTRKSGIENCEKWQPSSKNTQDLIASTGSHVLGKIQSFQSKQGLPIYRETPIVSIVIYQEALETHGLEAKVNHGRVSCAR